MYKFRIYTILIVLGLLYNEVAPAGISSRLPVACKGLASLSMLIELPPHLETRELIESSYQRWGKLFSGELPFANEVEGILAKTRYIRSLPEDQDGNERYLFEGQDRIQRRWHIVLKVKKGQHMDDGKLISMNPASLPNERRSSFNKNNRTFQPPSLEDQTPEAFLRAKSKILDLLRLRKINYTDHIYGYMSDRNFSQVEVDSMIISGRIYATDGISKRGDTVFKMISKGPGNLNFRIIIGVSLELTIISVAPKDRLGPREQPL